MRKIKFLPFLLLLPLFSFAQNHWDGGVHLGYANYVGDLTEPTFTFDGAGFAAGLNLKRNLTPNFSAKLNLLVGKLSGDDTRYDRLANRGNSFEGTFTEIALMGEYDLLGHRRYDENGDFVSKFSPFVFLGVGLNLFNPDVTYGDPDNADARADRSKSHFVVPLGGGLKKDLNEKIYLAAEWGVRLTFSDYLDGVKLSGSSDNNDTYFSGGLTLGYRFGIQNDQLNVPDIN